jgi:hypothetical protein
MWCSTGGCSVKILFLLGLVVFLYTWAKVLNALIDKLIEFISSRK